MASQGDRCQVAGDKEDYHWGIPVTCYHRMVMLYLNSPVSSKGIRKDGAPV